MNERSPPSRDSNPFATCWTDHRFAGYLSLPRDAADAAYERMRASGWRGQLVGDHGAGKSTLLAELARRSAAAGIRVRYFEGFERLPKWRQWLLIACWRLARRRVVVTTHEELRGLPVLATLSPSQELLRALFDRLVADRPTPVTLGDAEAAFARHRGNLRKTWFDLHLLHEQRLHNRPASRVRLVYS